MDVAGRALRVAVSGGVAGLLFAGLSLDGGLSLQPASAIGEVSARSTDQSVTLARNISGTACSKAGQERDVSKATFVCKKKGKKLLWVQRAKQRSSSNAQAEARRTPEANAAEKKWESLLTPAKELAPIDSCKLQTLHRRAANIGWPRPSRKGDINAPRVFVLPFLLADSAQPNENWAQLLRLETQKVTDYYQRESYGKSKIEFFLPPGVQAGAGGSTPGAAAGATQGATQGSQQIVTVPLAFQDTAFGLCAQCDRTAAVQDILLAAPPSWNLGAYDAVYVVPLDSRASVGQAFQHSPEFASSSPWEQPLQSSSGPVVQAAISQGSWWVMAHELGHALFRWVDLYDFSAERRGWTRGFDLMGTSFGGDGRLFAWHRWLAGWVGDGEIRCVSPQGVSTHRLRNLTDPAGGGAAGGGAATGAAAGGAAAGGAAGAAAIVVPTGPNQGVVIENRDARVVVYRLDLTRPHGSGPVEVLSSGFGVGQEPNTSVKVGDVVIDIKDCDRSSCFVQVRPA